ncbi:hypothetical protein [Streptomyces sp. SCL15-4]|uniref:hypothetical protein n=1 Tax=Streptomyces sp. SCL15-4 TaxID=2967221 RepID=UPI0029665C2B|nr:hypothetical protein [Streptomyces sp. SCL15-4]
MTTEECLSALDVLAMQPFPEVTLADATGSGGPEHHVRELQDVRELQVSRDFRDDDDGQAEAEPRATLGRISVPAARASRCPTAVAGSR